MIDTPKGLGPSSRGRGWTVVLSATIGLGLGITGLPLYSMGQFLKPLATQFGWDRGAISGAALCLSIGSVLMSPLIGRVVDRIGVRRVALVSMPVTALGFMGLALNDGSLPLFYATWLLISLIGCGTTPVVWTRAVNSWFDQRRGLALGITVCGTGISALLAPLVLGKIISHYGWRLGYVSEGAGLLLALPIAWLFLHEQRIDTNNANAPAMDGLTRREAIRTADFWQLFVGIFLIAVVISGLIVHMVPMMQDRGIGLAQASQTLSVLGFAIIFGRLSVGYLLDQMPAAPLAFSLLSLPAFGCLILAFGGSPLLAVLLLGVTTGADIDLLPYLTSRRFGLRNYAELFGWLLSSASLGGGLGPVIAGLVHDITGSYTAALYGGSILSVLGAVLIGKVRSRPNRLSIDSGAKAPEYLEASPSPPTR